MKLDHLKLDLRLVRTAQGKTHIAVRARHGGLTSPLMSAEGCQFDDAVAEVEYHPSELIGVDACRNCLEPLMKEKE